MFRIVFNTSPVVEALRAAEARLDDMTPTYEEIGEYMIEQTKERFRLGVSPDGTKWAPKRPATLARYAAHGDGNLPNPLIGPSRRLSNEIHRFASPSGVEIGSALEYSAVHQNGALKGKFGRTHRKGFEAGQPIPWGNIPARVWLGLSEENERTLIEIAEDYVFPE